MGADSMWACPSAAAACRCQRRCMRVPGQRVGRRKVVGCASPPSHGVGGPPALVGGKEDGGAAPLAERAGPRCGGAV
eukprot:9409125-Pyramimonas_sp.AAC.1